MKSILRYILKKTGYEQLGVFYGYLSASGRIKSLISKKPSDANGLPLPCYSYSLIYFLNEKLKDNVIEKLNVFEFGS
jgi:hypothetical protein